VNCRSILLLTALVHGCSGADAAPRLDQVGDPCRGDRGYQCIDEHTVLRCEDDVLVMTDCGQVCANLGPAWTTSSCDEYECVCVPTDPLSCWPGEVNCVSEEVLQQCSDSQLWEAMECVQLCAAKGLISAGCNEQVDPLTGDHRADCWCSGEDTPCAPGTPPICVDKVSIASCVDGSWLFQDCTDLCAGPGQCVPWQQPATCEC